MLNRIILMGRLTRDPELRQTQSGASVANFSLAVDRDFKDKQTGEKPTDFIDIVAWRSSAEFVSRRAVCSSGTGPTGTATSAVPPRCWPSMCTLATPSGMRNPAGPIHRLRRSQVPVGRSSRS